MGQLLQTMRGYVRWLIGLVGLSLLPYLGGVVRDALVQRGIEIAWDRLHGPTMLFVILGWMADHALASVVIATCLWVSIFVALAQRRIGEQTAPPGPYVEPIHERLRVLYLAAGQPAYQVADRLLQRIAQELMNPNRSGFTPGGRSLGVMIQGQIRDQAQAAAARLHQCLSERDTPMFLAAFGNFYYQYQAVSAWIQQGAEAIGFVKESDTEYLGWHERDGEFLGKLNEVSAGTGYEVLRAKVLSVGWGEGTRPMIGRTPAKSPALTLKWGRRNCSELKAENRVVPDATGVKVVVTQIDRKSDSLGVFHPITGPNDGQLPGILTAGSTLVKHEQMPPVMFTFFVYEGRALRLQLQDLDGSNLRSLQFKNPGRFRAHIMLLWDTNQRYDCVADFDWLDTTRAPTPVGEISDAPRP